jgi:hypothetical protein
MELTKLIFAHLVKKFPEFYGPTIFHYPLLYTAHLLLRIRGECSSSENICCKRKNTLQIIKILKSPLSTRILCVCLGHFKWRQLIYNPMILAICWSSGVIIFASHWHLIYISTLESSLFFDLPRASGFSGGRAELEIITRIIKNCNYYLALILYSQNDVLILLKD